MRVHSRSNALGRKKVKERERKRERRRARALHPINQILSPFLIQISAADDGESFVRIVDYYQLLSDGCRCRWSR